MKSDSAERAKHLERNRIAANKCRERKKRENRQIERRLSDEVDKKEILLAQLHGLQDEVWELKNLIFQHAGCDDHHINRQLSQMTQSVLSGPIPDLQLSDSPKSWSDESVEQGNLIDPGASEWALPSVGTFDGTESFFENFIDDNLCT